MTSAVKLTKTSIQVMLDDDRPEFVMAVIGRALSALFKYQTSDEQESNTTNIHNNVGFAGCDAKSGSLTAKFWMKHKRLEPWMVNKWCKKQKNGFARLTKYHRQLNYIANK